jgi:hypothetical protein
MLDQMQPRCATDIRTPRSVKDGNASTTFCRGHKEASSPARYLDFWQTYSSTERMIVQRTANKIEVTFDVMVSFDAVVLFTNKYQ